MIDPVMLDTGVLGKIAHPKPNREIAEWYDAMVDAGRRIIIPEIADYELRREFIRGESQLARSLIRLNELRFELEYAPITTTTMDLAALLWAESRKRGKPTADPKELDGDAILAAQARIAGAIVATTNVGHLAQWVIALEWHQIAPDGTPPVAQYV